MIDKYNLNDNDECNEEQRGKMRKTMMVIMMMTTTTKGGR